ncbi:hypothetical protein [Laspinema palackyanum]|uniref:hypothetical protein n=1 Tax=Laspinema palackyanum TaxID=3231601 RepID=UPI00345D7FD0|nr:hypothetical protein [Laspinema sp. D2c]
MSFLEIVDATFRGMDPSASQKLQDFQNWTKQTGTRMEEAARNITTNPENGASDEGLNRIINSINPNSENSRRSQAELDYRDSFNRQVDDYVRQIQRDLNSATNSEGLRFGGYDPGSDSSPASRPRQPFGLGDATIKNEITTKPNATKEEEKINTNGLQAAGDWASGVYSGITGSEIFGELRAGIGALDQAITGGRLGQFIQSTKEGENLLGKAIDWLKGGSTGAKITRGFLIGGAVAAVVSGGLALGIALGGSALAALISLKGLAIAGAAAGVGALVWPVAKGIIRWGVSAFQRLWNFNFNASDADLKKIQEQRIVALYGIAGGALGSALGRLICGAAGVGSVGVFNPKLAASIASIAGPDQMDEILDEMVLLLRSARDVAVAGIISQGYQNIRSWIKGAARSPYFKRNFPQAAGLIAKWGEEGGSPWSFAIATENFVESIKDKRIQNFVEEFVEEFGEGCTESLLALTVV